VTYLSQHKLAVMNGDGAGSFLTNTPGKDYLPRWSPDGKNLAFIRVNGVGQDGAINILPVGANTPHTLDGANLYNYFLWMPDSQNLVGTRGFSGAYDIYLIQLQTGSPTLVARNATAYPAVSPDGKKLLLLLNTGTPCDGKGCIFPNDVWQFDVATQKSTQLTGDALPKTTIAWAPDGQQLAYRLADDTQNLVQILDLAGKPVSAQTAAPWWFTEWVKSPDGTLAAYPANDVPGSKAQVVVRPIAGGDPRIVSVVDPTAEADAYIDTLRWRPDGTGFVFNSWVTLYTVNLNGSDLRTLPVRLENVFFDVRPTVDEYAPLPMPTAPASWQLCLGGMDSRLDVGRQAQVSLIPPEPNNVRSGPTKDSKIIGQIQPGEKVEILGGPTCDNGLTWWEIRSLSSELRGYTLEGDLKTYWLEPVK
jgi:Tol biopolymer transport system component